MKNILRFKFILVVILAAINFPAFSQTKDSTSTKPGGHTAKLSFAGFTNGTIEINSHLEDSLSFDDDYVNAHFKIKSFNLALKCNGNTIKYLENKNGNKLTAEMKNEVSKLHPNCSITFDGIKTVSVTKDAKGNYTEFKPAPLKLQVK